MVLLEGNATAKPENDTNETNDFTVSSYRRVSQRRIPSAPAAVRQQGQKSSSGSRGFRVTRARELEPIADDPRREKVRKRRLESRRTDRSRRVRTSATTANEKVTGVRRLTAAVILCSGAEGHGRLSSTAYVEDDELCSGRPQSWCPSPNR
jgi:hypothetical protein